GRELVGRVRERVLEAHAHQDLPFERLVDELSVERSLAHAPLFQAMFSFAGAASDADGLRLGGVEVEPLGSGSGSAKFDLTLGITDAGERLPASLSFRADLWEGATVERMLAHFGALLEALARSPEQPVAGLPMLSAAERTQLLAEWNATDRPYPAGERVHDLFAAQAARTPDAVAVSWRGERTTYAELDRLANRIAHALRRRGVGPETRVGVSMARTPALLAALLGVLKAGGAYVPLDPGYPAERLGWMVEDAGIRLVLTESALAGGLPEGVDALALDGAGEELAAGPETAPESGALPDNLAYVIFTSGSTGRPKGVMVRHSSVAALLHWMREEFGDEERRSVLFSTSVSFDVSVGEMFGTLAWGGRLVLVENALELPAVPAEEQVTSVGTVPTAAAELLRTGGIPASVRVVNLAGEAVPAPLARAIHELGHVATLRNLYGPTEDTVFSTFAVVPRGADPVPMGRPLANSRAYVLDARLQPVPTGVVGELYLAGAGLARGYAARPELTAERFLPDPFGPAGSRMYRVMDRARRLPDGQLEYSGRADFQVKVRGFRIELGEIEAVLARHPAVRDAVAVVREDHPGERRIVAYVTPAGDARPGAAELREHAGKSLPEYMVPSAFVALETLPLSPNGKTDRRALPRPDAPAGEGVHVEPRTDTERALAAVWAETLRVERVGVHDGFFALGGHSLVATRVVSRLREALGVELPLRAIFEAPTVAALAARVDDLLRAGESPEPAAPAGDASAERRELVRGLLRRRAAERREEQRVRPRATDGSVPLSFAQQRLWFIQQMDPASTAYNMAYPLRLRGRLDVAAMRRSLTEIVARHESLRTVFAAAAGEPVQRVLPAAPAALPVVDLSGLPVEPREAEVRRRVAEDSERPFDLARGPLLRASLFRLADEDWGLVFDLHHIVTDGWSMGVLTRELSALYHAFSRGRPSPLEPLPVQYPDFAAWQRERLGGDALEAQVSYWREALAGAPPVLELPTDRPRPPVLPTRAGHRGFVLPAETAAALRELARGEGVTPFIALLAAFQALLGRWSGQDDISVGTPVAGRGRLELEGVIGMFVNTLVLRTRLDGDPTFRELLARVREGVLGAFSHQDVPFEKLVEELRVERSLQHTPLFQVMFSLQNHERGELEMGGLRVGPLARGAESAKFDLGVTLVEEDGMVGGGVSFRADLFDGATVGRMLEHYANLLGAVAADPDRRLSGVEILGAAERARVLEEWNRTARPWPRGVCIHELFEEQARRRPGAPALAWGGVELTYAGLDARANRLAHHLAGLGVGPESRVGVMLERGPELVVSILAVLKAGGCYVPLDPGYPAERLALMLDDSGVRVLLTRSEHAAAAEADGPAVVLLDRAAEAIASEPADPVRSGADPENLAYIVYTSGSTGRPKGVMVAHRHVVQLAVETDYVHLGPGDRVAQASNASFDALTFEAWGALMNGATLVGIPRDVLLSPAAFRDTLRAEGITTLYQTTALLNQLSREQPDIFAPLREVLFGGQAADADSVRRLLRAGGPRRLLHVYGPTETTAWCSWEQVEHVPDDALTVSVGRATGNQRIYLLDRALSPVPIGVAGEAYVGGDGVVRGYLDRPELTAGAFLPDPFAAEPGARMYRTGDRLRWRADGKLEFVGRVDEQVKVRGFRIEPGEIEAVLSAHPEVREARVIVREDVPGEQRLVAYVVGDADADALRGHLRQSLPEYMVPGGFVGMDSLPLTPNGKLDVKALPAPGDGADAAEHAAPRTPTEEILAGIWADVLHRERVGVTEDFFALGGHSLLATQVVSRAVAALGVDIPLRALFEAPTVAGMAVRADAALREGVGMHAPPIVPIPRDGSPLPLSFAQQRLWFIDQLEPGSATYNMPFPLRLRGSLDVGALEGALAELVRRHESLRTVFGMVDGEPVQVIQPAGERRLEVVDLRGRAEDEREAEARRRVAEDARRPFDLARGPLLRTTLLRLDEAEWVLLVNMHHVVSDGWSMGVLTREVSALYGAFSAGRPSPLPELEVQYADYAAWQRAWLVGETLERQIAYWKERLAGAPPLL
ncbi:MAG TPA: amino acid adenylation domain-containing protein, partial [Longimicrobiaceae bacterium]